MSRASMAVLFPDGSIRYGLYNGTTDAVWPRLFDTSDQAWAAYRDGEDLYSRPQHIPNSLPVRIFENYGGGSEWEGTATIDYITSGLDYFDEILRVCEVTDYELDTEPEWLVWR